MSAAHPTKPAGEPYGEPEADQHPDLGGSRGLRAMTKSERRAARLRVNAYHEEQLGRLVENVAGAIDRYRSGELDAFDVDETMFQYSRAAKGLWTFCNTTNVEIAARIIDDDPPTDWWERGAPRRR